MNHVITLSLLAIVAVVAPLRAQIDSFRVVGVHPGAAAQSTAMGKAIYALQAWQGKIYAGYGDYNDNTGPISIAGLDPATGVFTETLQGNTEAIYNYRIIRGDLYAPAIDRKAYGPPGDYLVGRSNGSWENRDASGGSTHAYDINTLVENDLWLVGSEGTKAAAWRSIDGGTTWSAALYDSALSGNPNDFSRFYFAGVFQGKLYVQARDAVGQLHPLSRVFDGSAWSDGPDLFPGFRNAFGWRPEIFAGRMVYRSREPVPTYSQLFSFDGTTARWHNNFWVYDFVIDGEHLYALADAGAGFLTIQRTTDLQSWSRVAAVPRESRSITMMDGKIYLGTTDSRILEYVEPSSGIEDEGAAAGGMRLRSSVVTTAVEVQWSGAVIEPLDFAVFDVMGRKVGGGAVQPGSRGLVWECGELAAGSYFLVIGGEVLRFVSR